MAGVDQLLEETARVGVHLRTQFADVRQERLAVEGPQPHPMQHEVVDGGVGEAQKHLVGGGPLQRAVFKQIRQQTVGVVPADGAQDHVDLRIAEGLEQVLRPLLRVGLYIVQAPERMGHEPDVQAQGLQSAQADLHLELHERLAEDAARKADDCDVPDHAEPPDE